MRMLQDAGIYVVADLSAPNISINRDTPSWNVDLYSRYTSVIDVLAPYNNVLGFFAGNEVSNNVTNVDAIPFVKAAVRDMKSYISQRRYRTIGVGYAADDDATIRDDLKAYLNCGPSSDSIDFFGYNIYSWCGSSTFEESGYAARTREFASYNIPAFFAEYGCNVPSPRRWDETIALFSSQMTGVWSGGIVYEYFQAERDYGKQHCLHVRIPILTGSKVLYRSVEIPQVGCQTSPRYPPRLPRSPRAAFRCLRTHPVIRLLKHAPQLAQPGLPLRPSRLHRTSSFAAAWSRTLLALQDQTSTPLPSPRYLPPRVIQRTETTYAPGLPTTVPRELSGLILDVRPQTSYLGLSMHTMKNKHVATLLILTRATSAATPQRNLRQLPLSVMLWSARPEELPAPAPLPLNPLGPAASAVVRLLLPPEPRAWSPFRTSTSAC